MILSGLEIERQLNKNIFIEPFDKARLNPNSYNLSLHNELIMYKDEVLNMRADNPFQRIYIDDTGLMLLPGRLYLGRTCEFTYTKNFVPMLEGRSSIGRLGLNIHATAGFGDAGFKGYWTLELSCVQPIWIYPFVEICQIYYHTIEGDFEPYKGGKYQNNTDIQTSQLYKELV